jgi:hypothetical protein
MKIHILLLFPIACIAMEDVAVHNGKQVCVTNNITLSNTQSTRPVRPGQKHPSVIEAHERLKRIQEEQDAVTCCCFFKIKKRI